MDPPEPVQEIATERLILSCSFANTRATHHYPDLLKDPTCEKSHGMSTDRTRIARILHGSENFVGISFLTHSQRFNLSPSVDLIVLIKTSGKWRFFHRKKYGSLVNVWMRICCPSSPQGSSYVWIFIRFSVA
jgi:hypothetical protein